MPLYGLCRRGVSDHESTNQYQYEYDHYHEIVAYGAGVCIFGMFAGAGASPEATTAGVS